MERLDPPDVTIMTTTTIHANRQLVQRYIDEVWHEGQSALPFFDAGYRRYLTPTGTPLTAQGQQDRIIGFRAAFPDLRFTVETMIAEGNHVLFHCTLRGTHLGPFAGHAATGRCMAIGLMDVVRISDGKFMEQWGGPDLHDLGRQLGLSLG